MARQPSKLTRQLMSNTHRRRRHDKTRQFRCGFLRNNRMQLDLTSNRFTLLYCDLTMQVC